MKFILLDTEKFLEIKTTKNTKPLMHDRSAENAVFMSFENCKTFRSFYFSVYGWGKKSL